MLKSWTIENFKSVSKSTTLDLAPLTIFAGENSSGKSTVIQSILLVAQTLQSSSWGRCVVLNGNIARLGSFDDICSAEASTKAISIGFELRPTTLQSSSQNYQKFVYLSDDYLQHVKAVTCSFAFSAGSVTSKENLQLHPRLEKCSLDVSYDIEDGGTKIDSIHIHRRTASVDEVLADENIHAARTPNVDAALAFLVDKPKVYTPRLRRDSAISKGKTIGCFLRHFLPNHLAYSYDKLEAQCRSAIDSLLRREILRTDRISQMSGFDFLAQNNRAKLLLLDLLDDLLTSVDEGRRGNLKTEIVRLKEEFSSSNWNNMMRHFSPTMRRQFAERIGEKDQTLTEILKDGRLSEFQIGFGPFETQLDESVDYIEGFFSTSVKYIGPLRDEPKPIYPLGGGSESVDVGYRGELTASVLETHKSSIVSYIPSADFAMLGHRAELKEGSLIDAVQDWLNHIGVAQTVETSDKGKLGHELRISPPGSYRMHDLTHVGVGVSQLLPILVQSLLMPSTSLLILEQPELHLHPSVQSKLADFLVSLALAGKQCIVETHSEYLINRLRLLSVRAEDSAVAEIAKIYFVQKRNGTSQYKPMHINEFGVITNWPKGFFDEAEDLAAETVRAAAQKRLRRAAQAKSKPSPEVDDRRDT